MALKALKAAIAAYETGDYTSISAGDALRLIVQAAKSRALLAEHPTDDAESVTEEWLRDVGFTGPNGLMGIVGGESELTTTASSRWLLSNPSEISADTVYIPAPRTRGDTRRLCSALGITLAPKG